MAARRAGDRADANAADGSVTCVRADSTQRRGQRRDIPHGGQVVIGGTCSGNKINNLDVIGGCTERSATKRHGHQQSFNGTR